MMKQSSKKLALGKWAKSKMAATLSPSIDQFRKFKHLGYKYATFVLDKTKTLNIHLLVYKRAKEYNTQDVKPMKKPYRIH